VPNRGRREGGATRGQSVEDGTLARRGAFSKPPRGARVLAAAAPQGGSATPGKRAYLTFSFFDFAFF